MAVHQYQADSNCENSRMTCRSFIQLPLNVDEIDAIIDTHILKTPHDILVHLVVLDNGIKPDIGTLKKDRGDTFS